MLFNPNDINPDCKKEKHISTGAKELKKNLRLINELGKKDGRVAEVIGKIKKKIILCYVTSGEWSTHNLMNHILEQIGPAEVIVVSWSVSNPALNYLLHVINKGKIKNIKMLLDWRVKIRCTNLKQTLEYNNIKVKFVNCHAKMLLVQNDKYYITVFSSANLTNNPRLESGVLIEDKETFDFNLNWIMKEFENANPFEN